MLPISLSKFNKLLPQDNPQDGDYVIVKPLTTFNVHLDVVVQPIRSHGIQVFFNDQFEPVGQLRIKTPWDTPPPIVRMVQSASNDRVCHALDVFGRYPAPTVRPVKLYLSANTARTVMDGL